MNLFLAATLVLSEEDGVNLHQEMTPTSSFGTLVRGRSPSKTLMFTADWLSTLVENTWQMFKHHPEVC